MTVYQWLTIGLGALGFLVTWTGIWFGFGRAVEQLKAALKKEIEQERDKILSKIDELEEQFREEQSRQDHNFGEVGAAMRQYIADVEKKLREVEIWGRDHYLKIDDFERAVEKLSTEFRIAVGEIKSDIRELLKTRQG
jgi:hypothetical protein